MGKEIQTRRERLTAWWGRRTRVGKIAVVLLAVICGSTMALMVDVLPTLDTVLITISGMALTPLLLILLFRWFTYRVLWRVRNRLILTYLLMGLAPVVMFATLTAIAAYVLGGQYATTLGMSQVTQGLTRVRDQAGSAAVFGTRDDAKMAQAAGYEPTRGDTAATGGTAVLGSMAGGGHEDAAPLSLMEWKGNTWVPLGGAGKASADPLTSGPAPAWLHPGFQGIVEHAGLLYLCAEVSAPRYGRPVVVLASRPLTRDELNVMAKGLGRILLSQGFSKLTADTDKDDADTGETTTPMQARRRCR